MSQQQLAERANTERTTISNIETARQAVTLDMFCRIADALNESPGDFLNLVLASKNPVPEVSEDEVGDSTKREMILKTVSKEA